MSDLAAKISEALAGADLVLGWTASGPGGVAAPARFYEQAEAQQAVFDSTCVHNLAVHLPRLKERRVGIVAKPCDARAVNQLIAEREIDPGRVSVIGVECPSMVDVKTIWRRFGYGARIEDDGERLLVNGAEVERGKYTPAKCADCADRVHPAGEQSAAVADVTDETAADERQLRERFNAMSPAERREFWREQYSRCIRCYACREACPMCYCRDVCIMQSDESRWTGGGVNAGDAEMMQLIRVNHLAGRCTGCGECERACPAGIPLMLLMEEQNRVVEELFGHRAGVDPDARPPLLSFNANNDGWRKA